MAVRIVVLHVVVLITLVLKLRSGVGKYEMKILLKLTDLLVFVLLDLFGAHLQVHGLLDELQVLRVLLVAGELLEYSAQHLVWIQGVPGGHHSPEELLQELGEVLISSLSPGWGPPLPSRCRWSG